MILVTASLFLVTYTTLAMCIFYDTLNKLPWSYKNRYRSEVLKRLQKSQDLPIIREKDLEHLPRLVQKYLEYTGNIDKPCVRNIRVLSKGQMKQSENADWIAVEAQQYTFFKDSPVRIYYICSSMYGVPFDGLHAYTEKDARMQIRIAGIFQIVNAYGEKMDKGETVTVFNDMCLLAPSSLIHAPIVWREIDERTIEAVFTNLGQTITARLMFDTSGALVDFKSNDRFLSADGKTYENYPWSTPVKEYREFEGRKIATYGEAIWHKPEGDYIYGSFHLVRIQHNVLKFE